LPEIYAKEGDGIDLKKSENIYLTGFHSFILNCEGKNYRDADILAGKNDRDFYRYEKGKYVNLGFSPAVFWLRLKVKNIEKTPVEWDFIMSYTNFDYFEFYYYENDSLQKFVSGDVFPFSQRKIINRNYIIPVNFLPEEEKIIYVKMQSNGSFQFPLEIMQRNYFLEQDSYEETAFGFFYGVMVTMMLYNLFLFFSFRASNYVHYVLSTLSSTMFVASTNGHAFEFLWANAPSLNNSLTATFMGGWIVFTVIFTNKFLGLSLHKHKIRYLMYFLAAVGVFTMISHFIFGYGFSVRYGAAAVGITALALIVVSFWAYFKKIQAARFFLLAWLLFLCGTLMIVLARFGVLPFNFWTTRGVEIGSIFEVILLSFALGDKFRLILLENKKMQENAFATEREAKENLEIKVKERTQSLQETMEELNQTNEELTSTLEIIQNQKIDIEKKNTDLTAGINYAKRIQQAFLPSRRAIESRLPEFLLFFKPRDIVSGDFYWFKEINSDTCFLALADCTGHGVPGALMSMIGVNLLSEIISIHNIHTPKEILQALHLGVVAALRQEESQNRDGMVISLFKIEFANQKLTFCAAKHGLLYVKSELDWQYVKGDRRSVGDLAEKRGEENQFSEHCFDLSENAVFYTYSDGFPDQFGGRDNKKYKYERLNKFLVAHSACSMKEQEAALADELNEWISTGKQQQIDDILICGFRVQASRREESV
jgi:serine phosphatase RsbU (regulator of sigma subunit)